MQRVVDRVWPGRGRVRRSKFWLFVVILIFFPAALMSVLTDTLSWDILYRPELREASRRETLQALWEEDGLQFVLTLAILLIANLLFLLLCIGRRRDRGQSGLDVVLWAIASLAVQVFPVEDQRLALLLAISLGLWGLALLVPVGFLKGTEGPNRFGHDPVEPEATSHTPSIFE